MQPNTNLLIQAQNASISAAVGPDQPNKPQDVLTVQRLINAFYSSVLHSPSPLLAETGSYNAQTRDAIRKVERDYFYGIADPLHRIEPNDEMFEFLRHGIMEAHASPLDPQLSHEMYELAVIMVPAGADKLLEPVKSVHGQNPRRVVTGSIRKYLPDILKALDSKNIGDVDMVLMALSTIRAEASGFEPVDEYKSNHNTSKKGYKTKHYFDLYDNCSRLGNRGVPDGEKFKGRGFVQLTGRYNYMRIGKEIGMGDQLIKDPNKANEPKIAALILAQYLSNNEPQIRNALKHGDLIHARKLVNGGSYGLNEFRTAFNKGRHFLHLSVITRARRVAARKGASAKKGAAI